MRKKRYVRMRLKDCKNWLLLSPEEREAYVGQILLPDNVGIMGEESSADCFICGKCIMPLDDFIIFAFHGVEAYNFAHPECLDEEERCYLIERMFKGSIYGIVRKLRASGHAIRDSLRGAGGSEIEIDNLENCHSSVDDPYTFYFFLYCNTCRRKHKITIHLLRGGTLFEW